MFAILPFNTLTVNGTAGFGRGAATVIEQSIGAFRDFTSAITTETAQQKFNRLASEWRRETSFISSIRTIQSNHAYLSIIGMGKESLPFIFREMRHKQDHWFVALNAITGINPIKESERGNVSAMSAAWLKWGEKNGYAAS